MNKILQRYLKAGLASAWESWREFVMDHSEENRRELVVQRCMKRMTHLATATTFDRWAQLVQDAKDTRNKEQTSVAAFGKFLFSREGSRRRHGLWRGMHGLSRGAARHRHAHTHRQSGARVLQHLCLNQTRGAVRQAWGRWVVRTCRHVGDEHTMLRRSAAAACLVRQDQMLRERNLRTAWGQGVIADRIEKGLTIAIRQRRDAERAAKLRLATYRAHIQALHLAWNKWRRSFTNELSSDVTRLSVATAFRSWQHLTCLIVLADFHKKQQQSLRSKHRITRKRLREYERLGISLDDLRRTGTRSHVDRVTQASNGPWRTLDHPQSAHVLRNGGGNGESGVGGGDGDNGGDEHPFSNDAHGRERLFATPPQTAPHRLTRSRSPASSSRRGQGGASLSPTQRRYQGAGAQSPWPPLIRDQMKIAELRDCRDALQRISESELVVERVGG